MMETRSWIPRSPRFWVGLGIAVLAVAFILQNRHDAVINLLAATVSAPLWLVLSLVFLAGGATGWLVKRRKT